MRRAVVGPLKGEVSRDEGRRCESTLWRYFVFAIVGGDYAISHRSFVEFVVVRILPSATSGYRD